MSDIPKVFTLPEVARAAGSDIQYLIARLIEYADFSVAPALLDELDALNRPAQRQKFCEVIADLAWDYSREDGTERKRNWKNQADHFTHFFWFDLFDLNATLKCAQNNITTAPEESGSDFVETVGISSGRVQATIDIAAGQWVEFQYTHEATLVLSENQDPDPT